MQKINDIASETEEDQIKKAGIFCLNQSGWVLDVLKGSQESKWIECFWKSSNLDEEGKPKGKDCPKVPFISDKFL